MFCLQLVVTPPVISTGTFITVLRMLSVMCANCPELALCLLKQNIADTLCYLLTGMTSDSIGDEVIFCCLCACSVVLCSHKYRKKNKV